MIYRIYKFINCFVLTLIFFVLISACNNNTQGGKTTRVSGKFPAFAGKMVSLSEIDIDKAIPVDTTKISGNGRFSFKFKRPGPGFYLIKVDNRNYLTLIMDEETSVEVSSDNSELRKGYTLTGSEDSEIYRQFEMFLETNRSKVDSLSREYGEYQRSSGFQSLKMELDENYRNIFDEQHEYSVAFLENHCNSLASLLVINRRFGQRKIMDEITEPQYFINADSCLFLKYPANKHLVAFHKKVEQIKQRQRIEDLSEAKLAIGKKSPEISLLNSSGNQVSLHSLHGSPVIITFWASTDKAGREANKQIKDIMNRLKVPGIKVYAIGLENYKEMWENAIQADGISGWINVTDFLGFRSSATSLFNIPSKLPFFILLDKNLIIVYRGSNIPELEMKLSGLNH
jgi:hypothetical protein